MKINCEISIWRHSCMEHAKICSQDYDLLVIHFWLSGSVAGYIGWFMGFLEPNNIKLPCSMCRVLLRFNAKFHNLALIFIDF